MPELINTPKVKMGLVAVSRDCFPMSLSKERLEKVAAECKKQKVDVTVCTTIIESEKDSMKAVREMQSKGVNACAIYLGNFGPEGPTTIFAQKLGVPFMLCGAAEESARTMIGGRGDAYCGMLNASLNCGLRNLPVHIPQMPVALPEGIARMIADFIPVARVVIGVKALKVLSFGPRPQDFYACNAPIKPLYDLGIEVMENSELDMLELYKSVADRKKEIEAIARDMARELGSGNKHPDKLLQLAQFELALMTFFGQNLGSREYGVFANKCWPAFEKAFGFVPCFVNSRLASRGIPAACEVDIYGAVSEYMAQLATEKVVTLLDINNSVPQDIRPKAMKGAAVEDLFMGFHCGNTASCVLCKGCSMKLQLIMNRLMEPGKTPDITVGTLEGIIAPGPVSVFRISPTAGNTVIGYVADGHVLDADPKSFGAIGVFGIPDFGRFYRHVLLQKQYPHHAAIAFAHAGRVLFDATRLLGIPVEAPRPKGVLYPSENPFL